MLSAYVFGVTGEHEGQSMSSLLRPKSAYMCLDDLNISNFLLLTTQISPDWSGPFHTSIHLHQNNMKIESMLYSVHNAIQQTLYPSYLMSRHVFLAHCCCDKRPRQESMGFDFTGHKASPSLPCWVVVAAVTIRAICFTLDILNYSHVRALLSGIVTCLPVN